MADERLVRRRDRPADGGPTVKTTKRIAGLVIRLTLALLCVVGGSGATAWMFLDGEDDE